MFAHNKSVFTVTFWDAQGNKTVYDCTKAETCFEAFLEEFLKAKKAGVFETDDKEKIAKIVHQLDSDAYEAGKLAYLFMKCDERFSFRMSDKLC